MSGVKADSLRLMPTCVDILFSYYLGVKYGII